MKQLIHDKLVWLNAGVITISFMDIEDILKIVLLLISIVYTLIRTFNELKNKKYKDRVEK